MRGHCRHIESQDHPIQSKQQSNFGDSQFSRLRGKISLNTPNGKMTENNLTDFNESLWRIRVSKSKSNW